MKTQQIITPILITLLLLLIITTHAQEQTELQAKGVTVYEVYAHPLIENNKSLIEFNEFFLRNDTTKPPYYYLNQEYTDLWANFTKNLTSRYNCSQQRFYFSYYGLLCEYQGISIYYDGYWLIANATINSTNDFTNISLISLESASNVVIKFAVLHK